MSRGGAENTTTTTSTPEPERTYIRIPRTTDMSTETVNLTIDTSTPTRIVGDVTGLLSALSNFYWSGQWKKPESRNDTPKNKQR